MAFLCAENSTWNVYVLLWADAERPAPFAPKLLASLLIISQCIRNGLCPIAAEPSFSEMENNVVQDEDRAAEADHLQRERWNGQTWVVPCFSNVRNCVSGSKNSTGLDLRASS